jgi:hypothetical protein
MMTRVVLGSIVCAALYGCSGGSGGSTVGQSGGAGTAQISGTLGGETFAFRSGLARVQTDGSVDVVLSDAADLCDAVTRQKFRPGETLLQVYHLAGTAPGKFTTDEIKYASVAATCPSGQPIEGGLVDKKGRATTSDITLSSVTASAVAGELTVTFDDGSMVTGSFNVPVCSASESEHSTCN